MGLAERLNGTEVAGKKIRVSRALDKKTLDKKAAKKSGKKNTFQVCVSRLACCARWSLRREGFLCYG